MSKKERIFLIGPRGSGKTTVGLQLAKLLGFEFIDADKFLEKSFGITIPDIFAQEGEKGFRLMESRILKQLSSIPNTVIGTGGGVVLEGENREIIQKNGFGVWLKTSLEILVERLIDDEKKGTKRPQLLTSLEENMENRIRNEVIAIVPAREQFYRLCADWECETNGKSPEKIAVLIQEEFLKKNS